jgi:drug/metabolite transporter (DMT)-like permease
MIVAAVFGLLTALFWGTTDFISRFPSRKIGSAYSTAYMQLFSLAGFSIYILATGSPVQLLVHAPVLALIGLVAGAVNVFGLMQLYRAFSIGNMSLSAPIASSYPIFTILFSFVILGQGIGFEKGIAIAIVISGVILTGLTPENQETIQSQGSSRKGRRISNVVLSALTASVFFGAAYVCLDYVVTYFGSVFSIWLLRLGAVIFIFPYLLLTMKRSVLPTGGSWKWIAGMAVLDSAGFAGLTLGYIYAGGSPAIVTTLSSMLGAVTTVLATLVYKDRLNRIQIVGIVILFLGVIIVLNV